MPRVFPAAALLVSAALAACTPTFNWREITLDPVALHATFPCKPDHAERSHAAPDMLGRDAELAGDGQGRHDVQHIVPPGHGQTQGLVDDGLAAIMAAISAVPCVESSTPPGFAPACAIDRPVWMSKTQQLMTPLRSLTCLT